MSGEATSPEIIDALAELRSVYAELNENVKTLLHEQAQARRAPQPDYYTSDQLMDLARRKTPAALHSWCQRNGIPSKGHHQWCRTSANTVLGIHE